MFLEVKRKSGIFNGMKTKKKEANLRGLSIFIEDIDLTVIQEGNTSGILVSNDNFVKMMDVSKKTAQRWRKEGKIAYVKLNKKIYYTMKEVERFVKRNEERKLLQPENGKTNIDAGSLNEGGYCEVALTV